MKAAPIGEDEVDRLAALHRYRILDTAAQAEYDDFTRLAAQICGTPIALVSLVDADRQWFKSKVGLDVPQTPRDISFCGHAIHGREVFEISDALQDERFADNPFVTQAPHIRFYAGAPLVTPQGYAVGTLCVIDSVPHKLTDAQKDALAVLGRQVVRQMELRLGLRREHELNQALARQAQFQKALLNSAVAAIITTDAQGVLTSVNPAAETLLGYRAEELVGTNVVERFHVQEELQARAAALGAELGRRVHWREALVAKALLGAPETREWHYQRKDGSRVPVLLSVSALRGDDGRLAGFVGLAWDITERKRADEALRASEARQQLAMTAARTSLWDANPAMGRIVLDAHWAELLGGVPRETEITFQELAQLVPPEEQAEVMQKMMATVRGECSEYRAEHRVRHQRGHWIWIESRGRVVERDAAGRAVRMIGTNTDISERKRLDQMKTEFVSTVSHELRTPLTSISGALGLAVGGALGELPAQACEMLGMAYKNSQRLAHLIDDLLDMEKLVAGKMHFDLRTQSLMPLVERTMASTRAYGEQHQVRFVLTARADAAQVRVDGGRLEQVLANFLSNAAKFSPPGAQVDVAVHQAPGRVRVAVSDHGPGIPADFRARMFQKFSQADASNTRNRGGTGLGLAISKELMERMQGTVGFESQEGRGACFYFELPLAPVAGLGHDGRTGGGA